MGHLLGVEGDRRGMVRPISPRALRLGMRMASRSPWPRVALQDHLSTWKLGPTQLGPVLPHPATDQWDPGDQGKEV